MRRFINCTVIFVVGLAAFADAVRMRAPRPLLVGAGALFVVWNLFFIIQFATGMELLRRAGGYAGDGAESGDWCAAAFVGDCTAFFDESEFVF